jgi:cyanophycin synthetase
MHYAHNPAAIAAVTLPGGRRDDLLRESARSIAAGFDRVVVYEDTDLRGRLAGEVPDLVRHEVARYRPQVECTTVTCVDEAMGAALALAGPGDVVLVLHEKVQPALDLLKQLSAKPVTGPVPTAWTGRLADREQLVVT